MKNVKYSAASFVLLSATISHAQEYIGASVGQSDIDISGFDDGTSIAVIGGYKFIENFALEASYINLGDSEDNQPPVWTIEVDGINFSAVGIIPVNEQIDLFAKVGLFVWDASLNEAGYGEIGIDEGSDISLGFGAAVNLTEQFGLLIEYQKFELDEVDVSNISIAARLYF
ncbi:porin family protein [Psychromonas sp.]|uniref:porin family protein n=1 Tax=Psychromonas sp. TaxID=1884585 RepID=UPI00356460EB